MFECWIHMLSTKPLPLLFYSLVSWRLGILFGEIFKIKMVHFSFDTFLIIAQFQDSWPATSLKYTPKTRPHLNVLFIHLFIHLFIYLLCIYLFFIYLFYLFIYLFIFTAGLQRPCAWRWWWCGWEWGHTCDWWVGRHHVNGSFVDMDTSETNNNEMNQLHRGPNLVLPLFDFVSPPADCHEAIWAQQTRVQEKRE